MDALFTRIIKGEIPCYKIAETEDFLAFLDINPLTKGHLLCIPKQEVDYLFDLEDELYLGLQLFTKMVAKGLKEAITCERIGVAVIGLEVPHAHIHLVPMNSMKELNFSNERVKMTPEEFEEVAIAIRKQL